jgi:hypothetical protein
MNKILQRRSAPKNPIAELTREEEAQLNTIIDLLIPSDEHFPPPSSLDLIDEFLHHCSSHVEYSPHMLNLKQLRSIFDQLNTAAGGCFCKAAADKQQTLLRSLEQHDPALFQELWTLVNHSYYTRMAMHNPTSLPSSASFV